MAIDYLNVDHGKHAGDHFDYQCGQGRYAGKNEVAAAWSDGLPAWAKGDAATFWKAADQNERANGRRYVSLIVAIPNEAADPTAWAREMLAEVVATHVNGHAYSAAVHNVEGNPHMHVMICQRPTVDLSPEEFFSRKNHKKRGWNSDAWLKRVKATFHAQNQRVAPEFKPTPEYTGGEHRGPEKGKRRGRKRGRLNKLRAELARVEQERQELARGVAEVEGAARPPERPTAPQMGERVGWEHSAEFAAMAAQLAGLGGAPSPAVEPPKPEPPATPKPRRGMRP